VSAGFGARLEAQLTVRGRLCLGIDPLPELLERWDLPVSASGAERFALTALDAAAEHVGVVKPQIAFFERFGADGYKVLEQVIPEARSRGLLVIADVKRGEIGTSMDGYAHAWLHPSSALAADAMTVNPYLGVGTLAGTLALAEEFGKGLFALAATSNPEAVAQQRSGDPSLSARVATEVAAVNRTRIRTAQAAGEKAQLGPFGLVVGATVSLRDYGVDPNSLAGTPILCPGVGAQGGDLEALPEVLGTLVAGTVVSQSRSILGAGPRGLHDALERESEAVERALSR